MKAITSDIFDVIDTGISGKKTPTQITSNNFIYDAGRKLLEINKTDPDKLPEILREYAFVLKDLVKSEMLEEMKRCVNNIDTFYN